jgi:hypothetical protein
MRKKSQHRAFSILILTFTIGLLWYGYYSVHDIYLVDDKLELWFWSNFIAMTVLILYRAFDVWKGS